MELDEVFKVLAACGRELVEYVLIGGAALNFHGLVRATEDIDLFVRPTSENIARLRRALWSVYSDPSIDEISAEDLSGDYPVIRYSPPNGELFLDILGRIGEFAKYDDLKAQEIEISGVTIRVATPSCLYWLKKGTLRAIDRADAQALREKFDLSDLEE